MATPTRTLNPLPFEHLEPSRFEDLIRQLAYDFRTWRMLEATGRSGSDQGFDIRGFEIFTDAERVVAAEDDESVDNPDTDRTWLFQCKREKSIGPKKLEGYFDDIAEEVTGTLYGLVFIASCNLSKRSRDLLRQKSRDAGIAECHVWTVSEIEDMLFQPRNDHLLFAYFGISLKVRQRSVRTKLRARLAAKRKAYRSLEGDHRFANQFVLVRDPEEDRYPYLDEGVNRLDHDWRTICFVGHHALGARFEVAKHFAFLDSDNKSWDMADVFNDVVGAFQDPWFDREVEGRTRDEVHSFWMEEIEEANRGFVNVEFVIPYESILDIDKDGDSEFEGPHVFVSFENHRLVSPYSRSVLRVPELVDTNEEGRHDATAPREISLRNRRENRVEVFPERFRGRPR